MGLGNVSSLSRMRWTDRKARGKKSVAQGQSGALTLASTLVWGQLIPGVTAALVAAQGVQAPLLTAPAVGPGALIHLYGEESDVTNHGPDFAPPSSSQSLWIPMSLPNTAGQSPLKTSLVRSAPSYPQIPTAAENPQDISHSSFQAFRLAGGYHQRLCSSPHPSTILSFSFIHYAIPSTEEAMVSTV